MTMPPMGKMKTSSAHRSLWSTGRFDFSTSTATGHDNVSVDQASLNSPAVRAQESGVKKERKKERRKQKRENHVLHTMMSRTRMMNPSTPPPRGACQAFPPFSMARSPASGAAKASVARQRLRMYCNMVALVGFPVSGAGVDVVEQFTRVMYTKVEREREEDEDSDKSGEMWVLFLGYEME